MKAVGVSAYRSSLGTDRLRHPAALVGTAATGSGAVLAMLLLVATAFLCARVANIGAQLA